MGMAVGEQGEYWAARLQRWSGVALALFLPLHFWVLGLALDGAAALDGVLAWTEQPLVKLAEGGLVALLALHLLGGVRVLMVELLPWREWQASLVAVAGVGAITLGLAFVLRAF